jgi:hypothetical protein
MNSLSLKAFSNWLDIYGRAGEENDARTSSELFALDAKYYGMPFDKPIAGRDAIYQYWSQGAQNYMDKESQYEVLSLKGNLGIARWQSQFTSIDTSKQLALDCILLVDFDEDGKCCEFSEWWHLLTLDSVRNGECE